MIHRSTLGAAERPSAIAHTMRLWPRVMSPQTNTPSRFVCQLPSHATSRSGVELETELGHDPVPLGPDEAERQQDQLARQLELAPRAPGRRRGGHRSMRISTSWPRRARHRARAVVDEFGGRDRVHPVAALLVGGRGAQDHRPRRPGVLVGPCAGGLGAGSRAGAPTPRPAGARCRGSRRRCRRRR